MIHYDLLCGEGHEFDGWFRDSQAFDLQSQRGQLTCPSCGASTVRRALMAPRLNRGAKPPASSQRASSTQAPSSAASPGPGATASPPPSAGMSAVPAQAAAPQDAPSLPDRMPDQMRSLLQRVRAEVERRCDYVGPAFAEEARRIHKGEAPERAIYGETSPEQAEALEEDGIKVARVPWVPRADG